MGEKHLFVAGIASKYGQRLRRFLSARVRNSADVPDLAQEVFLRLLRVDDHETIRSPEPYLFTIPSHILHQHTLRQSTAPESLDVEAMCSELRSDEEDEPDARAETQQRVEQLQRAIAQLRPMEQSALLLHRYAGFSISEIGLQLGIARPTAKKYLAKALLHCRDARGGPAEGRDAS